MRLETQVAKNLLSPMQRIKSLQDVVDWDLCTGCGACFYACTQNAVTLVNIESVGIRPQFDSPGCASCTDCLSFCPGYQVDAGLTAAHAQESPGTDYEFGHALEIWEGFASDPELRFRGSSGGVLSALALYCLEKEDMGFVLHSGMDETKPWANKTYQSTSRDELLSRSGSRYAPASPCEGLQSIEASERPCVFIGKPCDAAAVSALRTEREELDKKLGLVLTFFCAGTPSTRGTIDLLKSLDVQRSEVRSLRYRGEGWPGPFRVLLNTGAEDKSLTYEESWGQLTGYRPLRCNLCPDGLGRLADISCGDAWHASSDGGDPGKSIVLVRTRRGKEILHRAMAANYVQLTPCLPQAVVKAQTNLLQRRRELFGRLAALRILMIPTPKFKKFSLMKSWLRLPLRKQAQTLAGTGRRAIRRGWWRRRSISLLAASSSKPGS